MKLQTIAAVAVALAAVAVLLVSGAASAAGQPECFVNAATGSDSNGGASSGDAKQTIQACVNAVDPGGTVHVATGTYIESVNVNKAVTLAGAQAGTSAQNRVLQPESLVTGPGGTTAFHVTADHVTIDGFDVEGEANDNQFGAGVVIGAGTSGAEVTENILRNNQVGLFLTNANSSDAATVADNWFDANNAPGAARGQGIYQDEFTGPLAGANITNNLFTAQDDSGIGFSSTGAPATAITVSGNTFTGNGRGLYAFGLTNSSISANTFSGSTDNTTADIRLFDGVDGLTISGNVLENGAGRAFRVNDGGAGPPISKNVAFNRNAISGYGEQTYTVEIDEYNGTLDATCNWWGSAGGPGPGATIGGTGSFTYVPFLASSDLGGPCNGVLNTGVPISMGPQSMEGDLKVRPGDVLKAGYDFTIPGKHAASTVTFFSPSVTFAAKCVTGGAPVTLTVSMSTAPYPVAKDDNHWAQSDKANDPSVYQGSIVVPDACAGGQISLKAGGTFKAGLRSTQPYKVNVRWHYSANGSKGGWSATGKFVTGT